MNARSDSDVSKALRSFEPENLDLDGKEILITGGTGSFGQNFVKKITERYTPKRLIILSRDELKQVEMGYQFSDADYPFIRYFIGDVRDLDRLEMAMRGVDTVIHTAALKHVPVAEYNPFECVATNIIGAENVVKASIRTGVERVIALSTDKAANPINLYGATKLASDKIFVAANTLSGREGTRFSVVRYGNVIGSRGSVLPFFRRLLKDGKTELPITDVRMTRFWITLDQGVDFVLSSLEMMSGGEIFVPKIPSMKIIDLAEAIAPGMPLKIVGIRPGEKLHEALITEDDGRNTVELEERFIIKPVLKYWTRADSPKIDAARPVDEGFSYTSDKNHEVFEPSVLAELLDRFG